MKFYDNDYEFAPPEGKFQTQITLLAEDTFTAAARYDRSCCLNFASHRRPGGGYQAVKDIPGPIKTQEEDLFRRSNLPELMDIPKVRQYYPLKGIQGLYCPEVTVTKGPKLEAVAPFVVSLVTVPAVINPDTKEKKDLAYKRVVRIFQIAADNKQEILILGAWGCGAFLNDPEEVALLFNLLSRTGVFQTVVYAIPGKESHNYQVFEKILFGENNG